MDAVTLAKKIRNKELSPIEVADAVLERSKSLTQPFTRSALWRRIKLAKMLPGPRRQSCRAKMLGRWLACRLA
jgi:hypothetical protein